MFHYFFIWYQGAIWSNILASLLWAPLAALAAWLLQRTLKRHSDEHHKEMMAHISKIHTHLGIKEE